MNLKIASICILIVMFVISGCSIDNGKSSTKKESSKSSLRNNPKEASAKSTRTKLEKTNQNTIKIGYFTVPPHTYSEQSEVKGAAFEYFKVALSKMDYKVQWVGPLPLPRLTEQLKDGTLDGTLTFPKIPSHEEILYYTEKPIFVGMPTLCVSAEKSLLNEIKSFDDIRGFNIGSVKSTTGKYHPFIDDHPNEIKLEELGGDNWIESNLNKLLSKRVDALFDRQQYTMPYVAKKLKIYNQVKFLTLPSNGTPMFVTFSKASKQGKVLCDKYNEINSKIELKYDYFLEKEMKKVER